MLDIGGKTLVWEIAAKQVAISGNWQKVVGEGNFQNVVVAIITDKQRTCYCIHEPRTRYG